MLSNEENRIMIGIFEDTKEGKSVLLQLYDVLTVHGLLEGFLPYFEKEALTLAVYSPAGKHEFFLLKSHPVYVTEVGEQKINDELRGLMKKLDALALTVKSIAGSYGVELRELSESAREEIEAFFAEPIVVPAMLARARKEVKLAPAVPLMPKAVHLGMTRNREPAEELIESFQKTLVVGGSETDRRHAVHLIIEGFLLNVMPVIVFDAKDSFKGLSEPSRELGRLAEFKVGREPIGFPMKSFNAGAFKVDLSLFNGEAFSQLYGFASNEASARIARVINERKPGSLDSIIEEIIKEPIDSEFTEFSRKQAIREIRLVQEINPGLFNAGNDLSELLKTAESIGRMTTIDLKGLGEAEKTMIVHSIIKGLNELKGEAGALIVLLDSKEFIPVNPANKLQLEIIECLKELPHKGISYLVESEHKLDLSEEIVAASEAEIGIVKGSDAGINLKHRKPYRATLRPGLSICAGHSNGEKALVLGSTTQLYEGREKTEKTFA
jgi:hypothetical protein